MSINHRATPFVTFAATVAAAVLLVQCGGGSDSPNTPTGTTLAVSAVALNATSVAAGGSVQGTVSLTAAAPIGGASISISSSNPAVATVQTPLAVQAGASTIGFTVAAVAAGTATITASLNGSSQSPPLTVTARPGVLSSISLSSSTVVGGDSVTGTVTLTTPAPAGGGVVLLSGGDPVTVPASVTVPAGSASATFTVSTRLVGGTLVGTITASYGGVSASATLSVTRPTVATASFGVTGPSQSETCTLIDSGNTINCTFNGSTSTAPGTITAYDWSYTVATTFAQTTPGPVLTRPTVNCSLVPPPPLPPGDPWFTMIVTLKIHDDLGNVSAESVHKDVRLLPQGVCGF